MLLVWLVVSIPAHAQVMQLRAGSSSLLQAHGGSLELHTQDYATRFDMGLAGRRLLFGYALSTTRQGTRWTLGDQSISTKLPTDPSDGSSYFLGRGVAAETHTARSKMLLYAGTTSVGTYGPFFNLARAGRGLGLFLWEHQLSSTVRFHSQNILSSQQTTLQGLEWTPQDGLKIASVAGIGGGAGYLAGSLILDREWISLQGGYSKAGNSFHRVQVEAPMVSESAGANFRLQLMPVDSVALTISRQNYLSQSETSPEGLSAAVDSFGGEAAAGGFRLHGSVFQSSTKTGRTRGLALGVQRRLWSHFEAGANSFFSSIGETVQKTGSVSLRETINRQLDLTQVITHGGGNTTVAFGGTYSSNRFTIGLEHQTLYMPFAVPGRSPFQQVMFVRFQLGLPHDTQLQGATNVDAEGRLRYTSHASSFFYPGGFSPGQSRTSRRLPRYVVRGIVQDEFGNPVPGAAIAIGSQMVFANSSGIFLLRVTKAKNYSLEVLLDQFMFPGQYEVLSAPATVQSGDENTAMLHEITVRQRMVLAN